MFVASFEGWNDAGEAASDSLAWVVDQFQSQLIAEIDGDSYFDYQAVRPNISVGEGGIRQVSWPRNRIYGISLEDADRDLIVMLSHEPNYRWKAFCTDVLKVITKIGCDEAFTFGSMMAEVPHTRPTRLTGIGSEKERLDALEVLPSNYEGPTGIIGVLHEYFNQNNLSSTSLWATIPHYVSQRPQPAAMNELLNTFGCLIGVDLDTSDLASQAADWVDHVNEAVSEDESALEYVGELEMRYDSGDFAENYELVDDELPSADALAAEVEKFLRDQPPE
ncbi:MAG TPA: PAC2 family protein [Acidimicrobiia bacterium]|nr:PAC2 family protein [Acidimicrobiia bacterium]